MALLANWSVAFGSLIAAAVIYGIEAVLPGTVLQMPLSRAWRLDMPFLYRPESVNATVAAYAARNRCLIASFHAFVDTPYAIVSGLCLTSFSILLWSRHPTLRSVSEVTAIATATADVLENIGIVAMLLRPARIGSLAGPTWRISWLKWVSFVVVIPLLVAGAIVYKRGT